MPAGLTFDAPSHTYHFNGIKVPSVTQILDSWSMMSRLPPEILYPAALRGSLVHEATQLDDEEDLNEDWAAEVGVMGYVQAWRKFRRDHEFRPTVIEQRVFHSEHRYAGTLDRVGVMKTGPRRPQTRVLLDIKSGVDDPTHKMQTSAYLHALGHAALRFAVYLKDDGMYVLVEHKHHAEDWADWLACLRHYRWRERNNA